MDVSIGEAAGQVWQCLSENGELNPTALAKKTGLKRDMTFAAIGWLARENKLSCRRGKRGMWVDLA
jgi:hypothetical protein